MAKKKRPRVRCTASYTSATDADGKIIPGTTTKIVGGPQCASRHWMSKTRCQGWVGHDGPHWCYSEAGWLKRWKNERDKDPEWKGIASRSTPPGHKDYVPPEVMAEQHYSVKNQYIPVRGVPKSMRFPHEDD